MFTSGLDAAGNKIKKKKKKKRKSLPPWWDNILRQNLDQPTLTTPFSWAWLQARCCGVKGRTESSSLLPGRCSGVRGRSPWQKGKYRVRDSHSYRM